MKIKIFLFYILLMTSIKAQKSSEFQNLKKFEVIIENAKKNKVNNSISDAYLEKATYLYKIKNYQEALNTYILASKYINPNKDLYLQSIINHGLALTQFQLNNYNESETLLLNNKNYFENNLSDRGHQLGYLNTLSRLTYLNILTKKIDKAIKYNNIDFKNTEKFNDFLNLNYAYKNKGLIEFELKKYSKSINSINKALPGIIDNKDYYWAMVCYMYLGKNYEKIQSNVQAINYYNKVDSIFKKTNIVAPELRNNFIYMLEIYKHKNNINKQLETINTLLKFDSINNYTNNLINKKYYKEYEYDHLIKSKQKLQLKINQERARSFWIFSGIIVLFILIILMFIVYYIKRERKVKLHFDNIINEHLIKISELNDLNILKSENVFVVKNNSLTNKENLFSNNTKNVIINRLDKLEETLFYLDKNISLSLLAKKLFTNTKYLSLVINENKNVNFKTYINDLRIKYILDKLVNDKSYSKYSIESLAEEAGFKSRQKFSDYFLEYTKMRPSVFLNKLNKHE